MSLVTTPTSQLVTCVQCSGHRVTHITMTLTDGSVVDFASCHTCEHKTWTEAGIWQETGTQGESAPLPALRLRARRARSDGRSGAQGAVG